MKESSGSSAAPRTYVLTRLALALPTILILLTVVFLLMRVAPGDPITASLGARLPAKELEKRKEEAGYDKPILVQYGEYLGQVATLDLGESVTDNRSVPSIIAENGSATLELTLTAFMITLLVGIPLGLMAGRFRDGPWDVGGRLYGIIIYAFPVFFLGFLFQLGASQVGWPTSGRASPIVEFDLDKVTHFYLLDTLIAGDWSAFWDVLQHLALPALVLG